VKTYLLEYVSPYSRVNYSSFELAKMQFIHDIKNDVGCDIDMSILLAINAFAGKSWDKYILDFSLEDFNELFGEDIATITELEVVTTL
jgi:hypothetical protein